MSSHSSFFCFPEAVVIGPEASSVDPGGPPPVFDLAAPATPTKASVQEPERILTEVPEVLTGPEDELFPASAGTEVLESVYGKDLKEEVITHKVIPDTEEEVVVKEDFSETNPDVVDVSETVIEDVSPESEEPPSEIAVEEFITESTSLVSAKPTMESSEKANLVEIADSQELTEAPLGDGIHHIHSVTEEKPSEITGIGSESSNVAESDRPAESPSEHPLHRTWTSTSPSETPAPMIPVGEFEDNEIFAGMTPDPVSEINYSTQDFVLTSSEQTAVFTVTSGAATEDAAEKTSNLSNDESEGKEEHVLEDETTIAGPPEEAAAKLSRTSASKQEPEEGVAEEGEHAEEPIKEADGTEETLKESELPGGKPGKEPTFVEKGPKMIEEVPSGASQQERGVEAKTDLEVTLEKVNKDDVAETQEEGSFSETSEETTTEADEVEGLLTGSHVEETSDPEKEVPVNLDEEVPPGATESTAVVEPTSGNLEPFYDSEKEPIPEHPSNAPPEVVPHLAEGKTNQPVEISPESPREPGLNTSPVSPTGIFSEVLDVASPEDSFATPKYVVEYNNGNFPDPTEGPFDGGEGHLKNEEEENSVRYLDSSADAVSGDVTQSSCPQIGNEIDASLLWPPKSLKDQTVEMTLKLRGETYNDALRDRSSVHYQQLARHFTRRVRWLAQGPTSICYRKQESG